jgi:hypothetical protein
MMRWMLICGLLMVSEAAVRAEEAVALKDGPGRDVVEG